MSLPLPKKDQKFTYGDYLTWLDEERWELIDGVPYNMTPAPSVGHQSILVELSRQFANYLVEKTCKVFVAPFDVRLPAGDEADEEIETVVQPDLVIICEPAKLDEKGCKGAPDLVAEILSPNTSRKDQLEKFSLYERVGVKEYWVVHPTDKILMVFNLDEKSRYGRPEIYSEEDSVPVGLFSGDLVIDLKTVFKA
ncbi:MAG: Uma2 family endonuclease [bacterium]